MEIAWEGNEKPFEKNSRIKNDNTNGKCRVCEIRVSLILLKVKKDQAVW